MSDSVRPHTGQPTRLPCPWDSPGKNTGVGCHFLLQCMKVKSESEVAQSCPPLLLSHIKLQICCLIHAEQLWCKSLILQEPYRPESSERSRNGHSSCWKIISASISLDLMVVHTHSSSRRTESKESSLFFLYFFVLLCQNIILTGP